MYLQIQNLLNDEHLTEIEKFLDGAKYAEGKKTAGPATQRVKNNLQVDREKTKNINEIDQIILSAIWNNQAVKAVSVPVRILPPTINRHEPGMYFGPHTDSPVMGANPPVRTDIAISIFLSDPESYEGGELVVKTEAGDASFKLPRGDALVYPSSAIHTVQKVTSGVRHAAVTWVQSAIKDPSRRQILLELDMASGMVNKKNPDSEEGRLLQKIYGNLFKLWSEF